MSARSMGCLRKWRWRATPMPNPHRRASSSTRPVQSMRPLWPRCRPICADASCAPSSAGACWRVVTPKRCWPTSTAASRWTPVCCIEAHDRAALERLLRYCARPPFAMDRLRKEGAALVYRCAKQRSEPTSDKRGAKADELHLTPLELIDRIAALVPPPRTHRHRYFGVLAPNSPLRAAVMALAATGQASRGADRASHHGRGRTWGDTAGPCDPTHARTCDHPSVHRRTTCGRC